MGKKLGTDIYDMLFSKSGQGCLHAPGLSAYVMCSYVPVELVESFGIRCTRLAALGDAVSESVGGNMLGSEACTWCKSLVGSFDNSALSKGNSILVGCTSCDQIRRTADSMASGEFFHMVTVPATRSDNAYDLYRTEMRRLLGFLERSTGRTYSPDLLEQRIKTSNRLRLMLSQMSGRLSNAAMLSFVLFAWQEGIDSALSALSRISSIEKQPEQVGKRILLVGGPLSHGDVQFLELLESLGAQVVANLTCTGERYWDFSVAEGGDPLESLTKAYFHRPDCIWRRPNSGFYDYLNATVAARQICGIIWKAPRFCDMWNAEAVRARSIIGLPLLHLDTTYADIASPRVETRIEAFLESL